MQRVVGAVLGLTMLVMGSGCATITRGTTEAWVVESEPAGAQVRLSSGQTCTTPCTLELKRKNNFGVEIEKEGYDRVSTQVVSSSSRAGAVGMAGNVLIGGLIGIGVDAASGATKELRPNPLVVKLVSSQGQASTASVASVASAAATPVAPTASTASPTAEPAVTPVAPAVAPGEPAVASTSPDPAEGYAAEAARFAKQYQCAEDVALVSRENGREIYKTTCPSRDIQIECWTGICRML